MRKPSPESFAVRLDVVYADLNTAIEAEMHRLISRYKNIKAIVKCMGAVDVHCTEKYVGCAEFERRKQFQYLRALCELDYAYYCRTCNPLRLYRTNEGITESRTW